MSKVEAKKEVKVEEKQVKSLAEQMGELMFYQNRTLDVPGTEQEIKHCIVLAASALVALDKLNMKVVPSLQIDSADSYEKRMKNVDTLSDVIQNFVSKEVKAVNPRLFPARELAYRIIG